jgi:hypothetical protein
VRLPEIAQKKKLVQSAEDGCWWEVEGLQNKELIKVILWFKTNLSY